MPASDLTANSLIGGILTMPLELAVRFGLKFLINHTFTLLPDLEGAVEKKPSLFMRPFTVLYALPCGFKYPIESDGYLQCRCGKEAILSVTHRT